MARQKREHERLLDQLSCARSEDFHLEASWIAYAILEDRLESALKLAKRVVPQMLGRKITSLESAIRTNAEVRRASTIRSSQSVCEHDPSLGTP